MKTTVLLPDELVERARIATGKDRLTDLLKAGLQALIDQEARKRLVAYGGSDPLAEVAERRRGYQGSQL